MIVTTRIEVPWSAFKADRAMLLDTLPANTTLLDIKKPYLDTIKFAVVVEYTYDDGKNEGITISIGREEERDAEI